KVLTGPSAIRRSPAMAAALGYRCEADFAKARWTTRSAAVIGDPASTRASLCKMWPMTRSVGKGFVLCVFRALWGGAPGFLHHHADLLRRDAEQPAGIAILEHPQRAVGSDFHVANAVADAPAFRRRGAALAVEGDAVERLRLHPAHQRGTLPLREHRAVVE